LARPLKDRLCGSAAAFLARYIVTDVPERGLRLSRHFALRPDKKPATRIFKRAIDAFCECGFRGEAARIFFRANGWALDGNPKHPALQGIGIAGAGFVLDRLSWCLVLSWRLVSGQGCGNRRFSAIRAIQSFPRPNRFAVQQLAARHMDGMPVTVAAAVGEIIPAIADIGCGRYAIPLEQQIRAPQIGPKIIELQRILFVRSDVSESERQG
jgi:hypothetical protein